MSAQLISVIDRATKYPIYESVSITGNDLFITMETDNWTDQMFYELPSIQVGIYTKINGVYIKYLANNFTIDTRVPQSKLSRSDAICYKVKNVPSDFYLYINPIFDNNALSAHNELIENGLDEGSLWTTPTRTFNISVGYTNESSTPHEEQTITGVTPLTFKSYGSSLTSWSISGNMTQNETPSTGNIVVPEECGDLVESGEHAGEYAIPITLAGRTQTLYLSEPLRKIGNYSDTVNSDGTVTRNIKKLVFDGTEGWTSASNVWYLASIDDYLKVAEITSVCSHYPTQANVGGTGDVTDGKMCFGTNASLMRLFIKDTTITKLTDWRYYLSHQYSDGTPVTVWYVVKTPNSEQVTTPELTTNNGTNTLEIGTTLQPSEVSITGEVEEYIPGRILQDSNGFILQDSNNYTLTVEE